MNDTKSKGGRPPRTEEKLQRLTLNLRSTILFGLEMVARHRRTSLSQAAEHLLLSALRPYEIDGSTVFKTLESTITELAELGEWTETLHGNESGIETEVSADDREFELQSRLLGTPGGRALLLPESLQTSSERYFDVVFSRILAAESVAGKQHPIMLLFMPELISSLFEKSRELEEKGVPAEEAGTLLRDMTNYAINMPDHDHSNIS